MSSEVKTYYGPTGEQMVKLSDHQAILTGRDRQWREKVEALIEDWESVARMKEQNDRKGWCRESKVDWKVLEDCAKELTELLEDSE